MKPVVYTVVVILLFPFGSVAQRFAVDLSPKHLRQLGACSSGHKRLKQYYKFYRRDSTKHTRNMEKEYKGILDSAYRSESRKERMKRRLARKGIVLQDKRLSYADSLTRELQHYWSVMKDSTAPDSMRHIAKEKVKTISLEKARLNPGFQNLMDKYQPGRDSLSWETFSKHVPGFDTLSGIFDSSPEEVAFRAEKTVEMSLNKADGPGILGDQFSQAEQMTSLPDEYKLQYRQYTGAEHMKEERREKAIGKVMDYFAGHEDKLQGAQKKLSRLMSKYRDIKNSSDLGTAVKHTSMKGRSFPEHLVIGGNFNILSMDPFSMDLSPQLSYKITSRFFIGIGMSHRWTHRDSIHNNWCVSPRNTSYRTFTSYDVIKGFYVYAEWEKRGIHVQSNDKTRKMWKDNYFIGAGKRFLVHPKLYLIMTALYNLNPETGNPVHSRRLQIRIGFQLSELATRQKKYYYDPNR